MKCSKNEYKARDFLFTSLVSKPASYSCGAYTQIYNNDQMKSQVILYPYEAYSKKSMYELREVIENDRLYANWSTRVLVGIETGQYS